MKIENKKNLVALVFNAVRYKTMILKLIIVICLSSCEQFVEVEPPKTSLVGNIVFTNDATATSALVGVYAKMMETEGFAGGDNGIAWLSGLSSDEFKDHTGKPSKITFFANQLSPEFGSYGGWNELYKYVYSINAILEGLALSQNITPALKNQLEGEAKFMRAFFYFYLVNLYGDVPLITRTDYEENSSVSRTSKSVIYDQIIKDLKEAQNLLSIDYVTSERIRPNKSTSTALLARVYLYKGEWANSEMETTSVINNSGQYSLCTDLNEIFLKNSAEAIWQLQVILPQSGVFDAYSFIIVSTPRRVSITDHLLNCFEINDNRKVSWMRSYTNSNGTYFYPYKYKERFTESPTTPPKEYLMVFRLAEQYLIRAETRIRQGDIDGAQSDLNVIRNRAGLTSTSAGDEASLLLAIEQERQRELFCEWGHRWFDLKRTNRADAVLGPIKGSNWQSTDVLYPVPQSEITLNVNLEPQNPGY